MTHYVNRPGTRAQGGWLAVCGAIVQRAEDYATFPTCAVCKAWLDADEQALTVDQAFGPPDPAAPERGSVQTSEIALIDLSSIAHPIWHMSQAEPDPNHTSQRVVARVMALAAQHPHAAICCDAGRTFRHDLSPAYKANRPERNAPLYHQIDLAVEQLRGQSFPVWAVEGFEADDLIASAVARVLELDGEVTALVVSADKDLLQLVGPRVRVQSSRDSVIYDEAKVLETFGVTPAQMQDYLTLVGDPADNVRGAKNIGPKTAALLLKTYGTIDGVYEAVGRGDLNIKPAMRTALVEFKEHLGLTRALIRLRADVSLPFEQVVAERTSPDIEEFITIGGEPQAAGPDSRSVNENAGATAELVTPPVTPSPGGAAPTSGDAGLHPSVPNGGDSGASIPPSRAIAVRQAEVIAIGVEWQRQLDPRSMPDAQWLADQMFKSRMFASYGTPQAVLSTIMLGRELGLPAMASLRGINIIEGKHSLSAQLMAALVIKSGLAEYWLPVTISATSATFKTRRHGSDEEVRLTHTIEQAEKAGLIKPGSNWVRLPEEMLLARVQSRLARLVYPDVCGGLYTPEELTESKLAREVAA